MTPPPFSAFRRGRDSDRSRGRSGVPEAEDRTTDRETPGPATTDGPGTDRSAPAPATGHLPATTGVSAGVDGPQPDGIGGAAPHGDGVGGAGPTDAAAAPVRPRGRHQLVADAVEDWIADLTALGAEGLGEDEDLGEAVLDLTHAHPGGVAQLYAGRATLLSNLVRETHAAVEAHHSARAVRARAEELAQRFGVAPTYLATGIATWSALPPPVLHEEELEPAADPADAPSARPAWREDRGAPPPLARTIRTPVLLRGIRIQPVSADGEVELTLERAVEINPVLVRALAQAGAAAETVEALAPSGPASAQRDALQDIARLAAEHLPGFVLEDRTVVGTFLHPGQVAVEDLRSMVPHLAGSDVVAALAGHAAARGVVGAPLPEVSDGDPDPDVERGVGDVEPAAEQAVTLVSTGRHLAIDTPPGSDAVGVVSAVLARAAADGRTVTYVPGDRRTGRSVVAHLHELGLGELVLDLRADGGWREEASRSIRRGMEAPAVTIDTGAVARTRSALRDQRAVVRAQLESLHRRHDGWGVSVFDALSALARLTAMTPGPRTVARISGDDLSALRGTGRSSAAARLARAAALGAFTLRPSDTPWYGARLTTSQEAADALQRVQRLVSVELPAMQDLVRTTAVQTGLRQATTLGEWREQLQMLDGVADALDVFRPQVFEHSAADMVAATAPRGVRREEEAPMSGATRRRLTRQARDLVRPGRSVTDLHAELVRVQEQREIWRRHSTGGGWPILPDGLPDIRALEQETSDDVAALDALLATDGPHLADLPLDDLRRRVEALAADTTALRTLPERTRIVAELREEGLGELLDDLADRRVPDELVPAELDLAWWSSVLEQVLAAEPALSDRDPTALAAALADLDRLESEQRATLVPALRSAAADRLRRAVRTHRTQAARLWEQLAADRGATLGRALAEHPDVAPTIRPVRACAPLLAAQILPPGHSVDLVVLHGVEHLPPAQVVAVVGRARQVVVVGDTRRDPRGTTRAFADILPVHPVPAVRGPLVPAAAEILARHGYRDVVEPVPAVRADGGLALVRVDGFGMPAPGEEVIGSVDAEVDAVVRAVWEAVRADVTRSVAVLTPSPQHADRVREAVAYAAVSDPELALALDPRLVEPLVVTDLADAGGLHRDVVVFSVGYGANAHGRFSHRFGELSTERGGPLMATALAAARDRLVVVSTIAPGAIDRARIHHEGAHMLAELLDRAGGIVTDGDAPTEGIAAPGPATPGETAQGGTATTDGVTPDGTPVDGATTPDGAAGVTGGPGGDPGAASTADATDADVRADRDADDGEVPATEDQAVQDQASVGRATEDQAAGDQASADRSDEAVGPASGTTVPGWLRGMEETTVREEPEPEPEDDPIVGDLVKRLRALGLRVQEDLRGAVDVPIALGHADLPDEWLVAVLTDAGEDAGESSLRRRLDRASILERAGWRVERSFTVAVFLDPQAEAERLRRVVLDEAAARGWTEPAAKQPLQPAAKQPAEPAAEQATGPAAEQGPGRAESQGPGPAAEQAPGPAAEQGPGRAESQAPEPAAEPDPGPVESQGSGPVTTESSTPAAGSAEPGDPAATTDGAEGSDDVRGTEAAASSRSGAVEQDAPEDTGPMNGSLF